MTNMLIKMIDGGMVNYTDDCDYNKGCPTCNYGSEYINIINIMLTRYKIHVKIIQMYEYVLSEGRMIKLFLSEYNAIQKMTEQEFICWFEATLNEIIETSSYSSSKLEAYDVSPV